MPRPWPFGRPITLGTCRSSLLRAAAASPFDSGAVPGQSRALRPRKPCAAIPAAAWRSPGRRSTLERRSPQRGSPVLGAQRKDDLPIEQLATSPAAAPELVESFAGDRRDPGTICKERPTTSMSPAPQRDLRGGSHRTRRSMVKASLRDAHFPPAPQRRSSPSPTRPVCRSTPRPGPPPS